MTNAFILVTFNSVKIQTMQKHGKLQTRNMMGLLFEIVHSACPIKHTKKGLTVLL